jgi:hypothetical protein
MWIFYNILHHIKVFSLASKIYLKSFGTIIDFLMHNTQLEPFPYNLESLIVIYMIECVCRLKWIFLHQQVLLVRILVKKFS